MLKIKKHSVVIDTNIWISFLITGRIRQLDSIISSGKLEILFSEALLDEMQLVMQKPKLSKYFGKEALIEMLQVFEPNIKLIQAQPISKICRDPKDDFLLDLAYAGNANYLITGDADLLVLKKYHQTKIITLNEFLTLFI